MTDTILCLLTNFFYQVRSIIDRHYFVDFSIIFAKLSTNAFLCLLSKFSIRFAQLSTNAFLCLLSKFSIRFAQLLTNAFFVSNSVIFSIRFDLLLKKLQVFQKVFVDYCICSWKNLQVFCSEKSVRRSYHFAKGQKLCSLDGVHSIPGL